MALINMGLDLTVDFFLTQGFHHSEFLKNCQGCVPWIIFELF